MKKDVLHIAPYSIQLLLLVFWLYVALDKLSNLDGFHAALLRQPFPDRWADTLNWVLPAAEVIVGISLIFHQAKRLAFLSSALLLLVFSVYIALGVASLYAQRPCGCASVFNGLSWEWHLVVNLTLFSLSILGWYLTGPTTPMDERGIRSKRPLVLFHAFMMLLAVPVYFIFVSIAKRFPRRFAVFPGRPVRTNLNYTFAVST